jgi:uncharacterized membrane protein YecN with MAPEG domain
MPPVITALYGALNALFNIFLANEVSRMRKKHGVSIGQGEHPEMLVAIRVHSNNAEFVPLAIVLLLVAELCGGSKMLLHIAGGGLLAARVVHWIGMPRKAPNVFRFSGVVITWVAIAGMAGYLLYLRTTIGQ